MNIHEMLEISWIIDNSFEVMSKVPFLTNLPAPLNEVFFRIIIGNCN